MNPARLLRPGTPTATGCASSKEFEEVPPSTDPDQRLDEITGLIRLVWFGE